MRERIIKLNDELVTIKQDIYDDCPVCGNKHFIHLCERTATEEYKGKLISYPKQFLYCDKCSDNETDSIYYNGFLLSSNIERLKAEYSGEALSNSVISLLEDLVFQSQEYRDTILLGPKQDIDTECELGRKYILLGERAEELLKRLKC